MNNDEMKVYQDAYHNLRDLAGQVDKMQEHHEAYHKLRELDVRIAQDIFDWVRLDEFPNEQLKGHKWGAVSMDAETLCIVPHYSTNISAAWEIIARIKARFSLDTSLTTGSFWYAGFEDRGDGTWQDEVVVRAHAPTAPLAICRAALKFVEAREARETSD